MKLIHLTDTHLAAPGEQLYGIDPRARLDACIADINANHGDADLAVLTGDITHFGDRASYENAREALSRLSVPLHVLPGNHDHLRTFRAVFPEVPTDPRGNLQSVMDCDAGRLIFADTTAAGTHAGWYDEERLDWLEAQFRESGDRPVFLFMHHPPFRLGLPAMDRVALTQAFEFLERMRPWLPRVRHLFFGHVHRPVSGSWLGVPFSTLRGTSHQVALDFAAEGGTAGSQEPPAYAVVLIDEASVVVHTHDFLDDSPRFGLSDVGYGFWEEQEKRLAE
ncbi:MAG: phosphodiesterase [Alphaproteobacteria bacterium]